MNIRIKGTLNQLKFCVVYIVSQLNSTGTNKDKTYSKIENNANPMKRL